MVNDEAPQSSVSHLVELQQKEEKKGRIMLTVFILQNKDKRD